MIMLNNKGATLNRFIFILLCSVLLSSCNEENNSPPKAIAGVDQNQPRGSTVLLDGSNSSDPDNDSLTYAWSFISLPVGSNAALSKDTSSAPSFVADLIGEYIISLVVSDGKDLSVSNEVTVTVTTVIIYENDFSQNTLNEFVVGEEGSAKVSVDQGQLRIEPGENFYNRGYVALNLPTLSTDYFPKLIDNQAKVIWSFNISNIDGTVCGACNNSFVFSLFSKPDPSDSTAFGYRLVGGGFVGSRVMLVQSALASSIFGPVGNTIVDISDGLEPLPTIGAFKLVYEPSTSLWELYYEESTNPPDPKSISNLVGTGINSGFVSEQLSYLIMGSYNTRSAFFDNLTVMLEFSI